MAETQTHQQQGGVAAAVSNGLVRLHKQYYGKGPTKAKTYLVDDTVITILKGGFTVVERTLIDDGKAQAVHDIRHTFQIAMEERFTEVVGDATGRKVVAYMSQVHTDPDIALEFFELEPGTQLLSDEHEVLEPGPGEGSTVDGRVEDSSESRED